MARVHIQEDSDDALPEPRLLLKSHRQGDSNASPRRKQSSPTKKPMQEDPIVGAHEPTVVGAHADFGGVKQEISANVVQEERGTRKRVQRPLKIAHVNSLLLPMIPARGTDYGGVGEKERVRAAGCGARAERKGGRKTPAGALGSVDVLEEGDGRAWMSGEGEDDEEDDVGPRRGFKKGDLDLKSFKLCQRPKLSWDESSGSSTPALEPDGVVDLTSPVRPVGRSSKPGDPTLPSRSLFTDELARSIGFADDESKPSKPEHSPSKSEPQSHSSQDPSRTDPFSRPHTPPPTSPSKSRLTSPKKKTTHIPPPPHRPSIDAFWSQDVINTWNDQYSPRKLLHSPRKLFFPPTTATINTLETREDSNFSPSEQLSASPTPKQRNASPQKMSSPMKKDRAALDAKKAFDARKHALAEKFLAEVDEKITQGRIARMCEETGGVKVVWSRKLNSTAGRANWKREGVRGGNLQAQQGSAAGKECVDGDGGGGGGSGSAAVETKQKGEVRWRHVASIELAEKVIDDDDRLRNVIAHEYCHLANFMISGVKNNPHGKEFKQWASKVTTAFAHLHIAVTTKHTYTIAYKYLWVCSTALCGAEYKRHSRSIDPARHTCGACKGQLVQVQPVPRRPRRDGEAEGGKGEKGLSEYRAFVKERFAVVRRERPGWGMGRVMEELGREYRGRKERVGKAVEGDGAEERDEDGAGDGGGEVGEVVELLGTVRLDG